MNAKVSNETAVTARIFVAGDSPTSLKALRNWKNLESRSGMESVRLEVIDVMERPQEALDFRVLATPTLVLVGGRRTLRCMGTLEDGDYVMDLVTRCLQGP